MALVTTKEMFAKAINDDYAIGPLLFFRYPQARESTQSLPT